MKRTAIYPGSFDPVTNGHVAIIERGLRLFDKVVVAVTHNPKKHHWFDLETRTRLIEDSLSSPWFSIEDRKRVKVTSFENLLLTQVAQQHKACAILRGLRAVSDFEYEFMMAQANHSLANDIETVFLPTQDSYSYVSSSMVREIATLGGYIGNFVPPPVAKALQAKR